MFDLQDVFDTNHSKFDKVRSGIVMATPTSQSCTALDKLSVDEVALKLRSATPVRYQSYHRSPYRGMFGASCWKRLMCMRCGSFVQRAVFFIAVLATCATWAGLFLHENPQNLWNHVGVSSIDKLVALHSYCSDIKASVLSGHTNPCWTIEKRPGCKTRCRPKIACAPKVIFAGVNGCYNSDTLSPFISLNQLVLNSDKVMIEETCPMKHLLQHYQQVRDILLQEEQVFAVNDDTFITSSLTNSEQQDRLGSSMKWLSHWLRPGSKLVVVMCDPTLRLLRHISDTMVMAEPIKQAVHEFVLQRIGHARDCIKEHGVKSCQLKDTGSDALYTYLLQGIYFPYMVDVRDHIPSQFIHPLYIDVFNATSYAHTMESIAQVLSLPSGNWSQRVAENVRQKQAQAMEDIVDGISPKTVKAVQRFYNTFKNDIKHILNMFS